MTNFGVLYSYLNYCLVCLVISFGVSANVFISEQMQIPSAFGYIVLGILAFVLLRAVCEYAHIVTLFVILLSAIVDIVSRHSGVQVVDFFFYLVAVLCFAPIIVFLAWLMGYLTLSWLIGEPTPYQRKYPINPSYSCHVPHSRFGALCYYILHSKHRHPFNDLEWRVVQIDCPNTNEYRFDLMWKDKDQTVIQFCTIHRFWAYKLGTSLRYQTYNSLPLGIKTALIMHFESQPHDNEPRTGKL